MGLIQRCSYCCIVLVKTVRSVLHRLQHTYFISTGFQQTLLNSKLHDLVIFILHMYVPTVILDVVRFGDLKH